MAHTPQATPRTTSGLPPLGYLLSKYPSANHTYLFREVQALRAAGLAVVVASVDGDDRPAAALPEDERLERGSTFVVKRAGVRAIAGAHIATAVRYPLGYARGLATAVRLSRTDLRQFVYNLFYFAEAVVAGRYLWQRGCRHVHTHYASTVALLAARVYPLTISASVHGSAEFIDPDAQRLREKIGACTFVRAISNYGLSQLMLASPPAQWRKLEVVRLGVDTREYGRALPRPASAPFRLVSVGQLQPAKGFHILIAAFAELLRAGRDIELTLVGDGPIRSDLLDYAGTLGVAERVIFTGALTRPAVRDVLRASDVFVLASFAEGIPVVLMEAMASGVVCVASRITGIPELIEDEREGLLVTPADVGELARVIARLADDPEMRASMSAAARAKIADQYELDANTARLAAILARQMR